MTLTVLTEEEIASATVEELRAAYRELAAHHEDIRLRRAEKSAEVVRQLREQGKATGEAPYGFRVDQHGILRKKRDEQRVISRVRHLRAEGFTCYAIAKHLNETGVAPREGDRFFPTQIVRILAAVDAQARPENGAEQSRDPGSDTV